MSQKKNNVAINFIIVIAIIVFIIMIAMIIFMTNENEETIVEESDNNSITVAINENIIEAQESAELEQIKNMTERNRIEYYVRKFINYAEKGDYESAYDLLNDEYKENYFSTLSSFQEYIEKIFTEMMDVEYTNIERNGEIYVIWLTLTDAVNGSPDSGTEMTFVVKESDYNDFELSFSVV